MSNAQEIKILTHRLDHLESVFQAVGIPTAKWVSPADAAKIISSSRTTIMSEINRAEEARASGSATDLKWGTHYRKSGTAWQVNPVALQEVIFLPPEMRPY